MNTNTTPTMTDTDPDYDDLQRGDELQVGDEGLMPCETGNGPGQWVKIQAYSIGCAVGDFWKFRRRKRAGTEGKDPVPMKLKHELKRNTWLNHCVTGWGNGYVILPPEHPAYGKDYGNIDVDVHGGLTYADKDEDGNWKVGFDTAHHGDTPEKWTRSRVEEETLRLKAQLEIMQVKDPARI